MKKIEKHRVLKSETKRKKLNFTLENYSEIVVKTIANLVKKGVLQYVKNDKKSYYNKLIMLLKIIESMCVIVFFLILTIIPEYISVKDVIRIVAVILLLNYFKKI